MAMEYKVAVLGDRETVLGFRALGLTVYTPESPAEAEVLIDKLARENTAVIFITENLAQQSATAINRYKSAIVPAIIPIPDREGSSGIGRAAIFERVEKAVGHNIFN